MNFDFKSVLDGLKGHQEAVLAFGMAMLAAALLIFKFDTYIAIGTPALFYILYLVRMLLHDRNKERLAETSVKAIESKKGVTVRSRNTRAIGRTKKTPTGLPKDEG